jgi:uncharacterized protein (DUF305 family)
MKTTSLAVAYLLVLTAGPARAQDTEAATAMTLPEICTAGAGAPAEPMASSGAHHMDEAHAALMAGMDEMNQAMMSGMMAEDIDVAFVCGMIPHHQGAINMARAQLQYGDDEWAKALAQKVIDAQEQEIADMLAWLEQQAR